MRYIQLFSLFSFIAIRIISFWYLKLYIKPSLFNLLHSQHNSRKWLFRFSLANNFVSGANPSSSMFIFASFFLSFKHFSIFFLFTSLIIVFFVGIVSCRGESMASFDFSCFDFYVNFIKLINHPREAYREKYCIK